MASTIYQVVVIIRKSILGEAASLELARTLQVSAVQTESPVTAPSRHSTFLNICLRRLPRALLPSYLRFNSVLLLINHTISLVDLWMRSIDNLRVHTRLNVTLAASLANLGLRQTPLSWHQPWRPHPPLSRWSARSPSLGNQY